MRYNRIDNLRAFSIISMVLYHAAWDLVFLYDFNWHWYRQLPGFIWQQSICWTFILISGFCHSMSRRPFKNALRVFLAGLLVSAVTWIFTPNIKITFGILTFIGSAALVCCAFNKIFEKFNWVWGIIISALLFAFARNINTGTLGFFDIELIEIPKIFYANYFTTFFGLPFRSFYSSDYFSFFPWFFLYMTGFYLHKLFLKHKLMHLLKGNKVGVLNWLSKRSLIIYLLHQPVLSGIFYLIFLR